MPMAALAASGVFMLARTASDAKAKKEEDRAAQHGLPPIPEAGYRGASDHGRASSQYDCAATVESTEGLCSSPTAATTDDGLPPPYSSDAAESPKSLIHRPPSSDKAPSVSSNHRSLSTSSGSTSSHSQGVRIRTKGDDLKSGFPYHPRLFDLRVRPDDWQRFSDQVTDSTKFGSGDYAKMWAAAGSVALTGSVLTTAWVGRTINRSIQEKKVSTGLVDTSEGSLGGVLQQWNQSYFAPLCLHARLELSDSAMRKPKQKSKILRRPSLTYNSREERERKNEDRKFVIVVSELVDTNTLTEAHELMGEPGTAAELPVPGDPRGYTSELPGDAGHSPSELPTGEDKAKEDLADVICGIAELAADVPVELPAVCAEKVEPDANAKTAQDQTRPLPSAVKVPETSGCV